jgi:hypothetical protein
MSTSRGFRLSRPRSEVTIGVNQTRTHCHPSLTQLGGCSSKALNGVTETNVSRLLSSAIAVTLG